MTLKSLITTSSLAFVFTLTAVAQAIASEGLLSTAPKAGSVTISDPYADDPTNSPWKLSMEPYTTQEGQEIDGRAAMLSNGATESVSGYTPFFEDTTTLMNGHAASQVGVGCDGINLGGIIDGQLSQYGDMVEGFIQSAPSLAIMYLAYSQPTVKAVIDELNTVGQFGLDMTGMSCSGVRALADKSAEEKSQAIAEARCTADAGYKDAECISDDGLEKSIASVMRDTKQKVTQRSNEYLGKINGATGGLVKFNAGGSSSGTGSTGGAAGGADKGLGVRAKSCDKVDSEGLRPLLLGSSGLSCYDIEHYGGLLPNYEIGAVGESGVFPRTLTVRMLIKSATEQHSKWLSQIVATDEATYPDSEAFKAIYNRSGIAITIDQHRMLKRLQTSNPARALSKLRSIAQIVAIQDASHVVNRMELAVLNGFQNQPDNELLPEVRRQQFLSAVDSMKVELLAIQRLVEVDANYAAPISRN